MALQLLQDRKRSQECDDNSKQKKQHNNIKRWCRTPEGWVKVNIDVACKGQPEFIGMGCVVRNDGGEFVRARSVKTM